MAINPIQVPSFKPEPQKKEESLLDTIFKGVQIAGGLLQIPVAYSSFKENMAKADLAKAQASDVADEKANILNPNKIQEKNLGYELIPAPQLTSEQQGPEQNYIRGGLVPGNAPDAATQLRESGINIGGSEYLKPENLAGIQIQQGAVKQGGEARPAVVFNKADVEKQQGETKAIGAGVAKEREVYDQAILNFKNMEQSAGDALNSPEASEKLLINAARIYNPKISRLNEIGADQSLPEYLKSLVAKVTGGKGQKLQPEQINQIVKQGRLSLEGYQQALEPKLSSFREQAAAGKIPQSRIPGLAPEYSPQDLVAEARRRGLIE